MKKILLFLLIIFVLVEAQPSRTTQKIRWQDLTEAVKDSIRLSYSSSSVDTALVLAMINDSLDVARTLWRSDIEDSLSVYEDAITSLPFMGGADSSVITTADTIPMGYAPAAFTVDTVIVSCYGGTPNLTLQIYHSNNTALCDGSQTINTKGVTKISGVNFNDSSMGKGKIFYITPSVTTKPSKISVQLIGKKL